MTIIYPINGKNERMGSLFKTPKHLLLLNGKSLIEQFIENISCEYPTSQIIIITNQNYYNELNRIAKKYTFVHIHLIEKTSSQIETLKHVTNQLKGSVMFIDCDIVPITISTFNKKYITVFTFKNINRLLNYSNFKITKSKIILECNEKQKFYINAGAGIYYFPNVTEFNKYSTDCKSISECISYLIKEGVKAKVNTNSLIGRYGTLQDIFVDNFSFRPITSKDLSTGFTNNKVTKYKHLVTKIGPTVLLENDWYTAYKNKNNIPNIIDCTDTTIIMEYIKRNADIQLDDILELIDEYKLFSRLNNLEFNSYIDNIKTHLSKNKFINNGDILLTQLEKLNIKPTFCHGDLSVMNIIPTKIGLKLIDPLYSKYKFGSYETDIAKLCFSYKFYKNDSASFDYLKIKTNIPYLDVLIAAEAVRVSSYKKEYSFIAENLINELAL